MSQRKPSGSSVARQENHRQDSPEFVPPSPTEVDAEFDVEKRSAEALHIYPVSPEAILAFDRLCQILDSQPLSEEGLHYSRYVVRDATTSTVRGVTGYLEDATSSEDEHAIDRNLDKRVQTGYWMLSYAVAPSRSPLGWRLGYGKSLTGPVDFHIPRDTRWPGLRGYHTAIKLDDQGQLFLEALRNGVKFGGEGMRPNETRNLSRMKQRFSIADVLDYEIRYACPEHLRNLQKGWRSLYIQNHLLRDDPHVHVPVTPAEYLTQRGDWLTGAVIGRGGYAAGGGRTVIRVGTHRRRSQVVAVKDVFYTTHHEWVKVAREITTYRRVDAALPNNTEDRDLILSLIETIPSRLPEFVARENDSIALIFSPLGLADFTTIVRKTYGERLRLFASALCAIDLMHSRGIVHRDIKPANICIQEGKRALVVDLASVRVLYGDEQLQPEPGSCGTIGYLAPELESSSYSYYGKYDTAVDIWSLGASAYDIFSDDITVKLVRTYKHRNPFREREDETAEIKAERTKVCSEIEQGVASLKGYFRFSIEHLIGSMLQLRPADRISARNALEHPAMEQAVLDYRRSVSTSLKRKSRHD